jgi:hypothetical protein
MAPRETYSPRSDEEGVSVRSALISRLVFCALAIPSVAGAQCLEWNHGFGVHDGVEGIVRALAVYDDGHGPALYVGGTILTAGEVKANSLVKWTSDGWSSVGAGLDGLGSATVNAITVFDDGSGSALYVAGAFTSAGGAPALNIARWNGTTWSPVGDGLDAGVYSLCVFDDGTGAALYAGGYFTHAGSVSTARIARWNGSTWSPLAPGAAGEINNAVAAMAVYDDGGGSALYIAGTFNIAGGLGGNRIVRWDGNHFSTVGPAAVNGIGGSTANALCVYDDGSGSALYVGGQFTSAGGVAANRIAKWNGAWSAVGNGVDGGIIGTVTALATFDDGSGNALYVGGNFALAGGVSAANIAKWNGAAWSSLGSGVGDYYAFAIAGFDDGSGPALFVGGSYTSAGGAPASRIARWKSASWSPLEINAPGGLNGPAYALTSFDDGSGAALYAGGGFTQAGTVAANRVVRWKNGAWSALGNGLDADVYALCAFNDGSGLALYAAGAFASSGGAPLAHVAKWNGARWISVGSGVDDVARALIAWNDGSGSALYVGGDFKNAGGAPAIGIARWKNAAWSDVGGGVDAPANPSVRAFAVLDAVGASVLYIGGSFAQAGGNPASNIARWTGSIWALGLPGSDGVVSSLAAFELGGVPAIFAGGSFHLLGGHAAIGVGAWASGQWWSLGSGLNGSVTSLAVFDDGSGAAIFAGGAFVGDATHGPANHIARLDGSSWQPLGDGLDGSAAALAVAPDASGGQALYPGGFFHCAGALASTFIAEWRGCTDAIDSFCAGDGSLMSCPCALDGMAGRGCQNSAFTGGAQLVATGSAHPDAIVLRSSGELEHAVSVFLQGDAATLPQPFGDGWLCTSGLVIPLFVKHAQNGIALAPAAGDPSITVRSAALGDPIAFGSTRYYQTYYRDPSFTFCPSPMGATFNVTNGVKITW